MTSPSKRGGILTSQLDFARDVFLQASPQLGVVFKVVEMMLHPLAENIENPAWAKTEQLARFVVRRGRGGERVRGSCVC